MQTQKSDLRPSAVGPRPLPNRTRDGRTEGTCHAGGVVEGMGERTNDGRGALEGPPACAAEAAPVASAGASLVAAKKTVDPQFWIGAMQLVVAADGKEHLVQSSWQVPSVMALGRVRPGQLNCTGNAMTVWQGETTEWGDNRAQTIAASSPTADAASASHLKPEQKGLTPAADQGAFVMVREEAMHGRGGAAAWVALAQLYQAGVGCDVDIPRARRCFCNAALLGCQSAIPILINLLPA